jgi:4-alpha-glucanotransferase
MAKLKFLFGIHNHQPLGNFDHVFEELYGQCYQPYFEVLQQFPQLKTTAHFSGCLLEWLKAHRPEYLEMIRDLVQSGQLELLSGGFYEPILSSLPEEDAIGQIRMMNDFLVAEFGCRPQGLWLTERIWSPHLPKILAQADIRYSIVDDTHFYYAGLEERQMHGYYLTETEGYSLGVFPISKTLRYSIPFDLPEVTLQHLRRYREEWGFDAVTYADDGEKFGGWPETHQWVYTEKYLHNFFAALAEQSDWLETMTFGEYLEEHPPAGRVYLPMASYEEMMEWSLPYEAGLHFRELKKELKAAEVDEERVRVFLRGGQWDNFLTKYEESNHLHKRMLVAGNKVKQLSPGHQETSGALRALYRSQCNCAYWHGLFGGLYLNYLRHALYAQLITAENSADDLLFGPDRGLSVEVVDFNRDGFEEVIVSNPEMNVFVAPARGGALMELDYRPACFNLSNVLRRRPEVYHQDILEARAKDESGEDQPQSIHNRVRLKEEGLQDKLIYDRWDRYSFMDHCLAPGTSWEQFRNNRYQALLSFAGQPYQWQRGSDPVDPQALFVLRLKREGVGNAPEDNRLGVEKVYTFDPQKAGLEVSYTLHNKGDKTLDFIWVVEHNFTLLAGDAADRTYVLPEGGLEDSRMASAGVLHDIQTLGMRDGYSGFELQLKYSPTVELWRFPVETVSQSEEGFESVYQGSCIAGCWRVQLEPGQSRQLQAGLRINKL